MKIAYVTGSRAEFGRLSYILHALRNDDFFELKIIATGMHLSEEFGYTIEEIQEEFGVAEKVEMLSPGDTPADMARALGKGIIGITSSLEKIKPDLVLVAGDRGEALAAAVAASHLNIPVAHVGGGFVSGSVDDKIRDAITTFSDIHLVASKKCAERVKSIAYESSRTHIVGAPDLEAIRKKDFTVSGKLNSKYNVDSSKPLLLISFHPVTTEYYEAEKQIEEVCESISEMKIRTIVTYPNADAGGRKMAAVLEKYSGNDLMSFHKHIPYKDYLGLMNIASVIVGNSSAAIIEAPSLRLPAVNIGSRQSGRERAENVIDARCNKHEIMEAVTRSLNDEGHLSKAKNCMNPYGDGDTAEKVVAKLKEFILKIGTKPDGAAY